MPDTPPIAIRPATPADAERLARGVVAGVADYPAFAPPGWTPPSVDAEIEDYRAMLGSEGIWCLLAEDRGELAGQIAVLEAARAVHPIEDPGLGHVKDLFVRRDHWGSGLAGVLLHAAVQTGREHGFATLRLFVAEGQARARRFYEREGWAPAGEPFDDPVPGLTMVEYRRELEPSAGS